MLVIEEIKKNNKMCIDASKTLLLEKLFNSSPAHSIRQSFGITWVLQLPL